MDIEGTYTLQAPVEEVCQSLTDSQTLRLAMPGLEHLEPAGQLTYTFTLRIKQAPLRGIYQGKITVHSSAPYPDPLTSYRFSIEGEGQHNPFQGMWDIRLSQQQDNTVVAYSGALNAGKMSALLPSSLVKGAVKILIQQFFTNLAEHLRTTAETLYPAPGFDGAEAQEETGDAHPGRTGEYARENGRHIVDSFKEPIDIEVPVPARTVMHRLVRLVGLGNHDPALEERWVSRLKRFGAFSVLLLLVWIGTRLPRRLLPRD